MMQVIEILTDKLEEAIEDVRRNREYAKDCAYHPFNIVGTLKNPDVYWEYAFRDLQTAKEIKKAIGILKVS